MCVCVYHYLYIWPKILQHEMEFSNEKGGVEKATMLESGLKIGDGRAHMLQQRSFHGPLIRGEVCFLQKSSALLWLLV